MERRRLRKRGERERRRGERSPCLPAARSPLSHTFGRRVRLKHPVRRPPGLGVRLQLEQQVPPRKVGGALSGEREEGGRVRRWSAVFLVVRFPGGRRKGRAVSMVRGGLPTRRHDMAWRQAAAGRRGGRREAGGDAPCDHRRRPDRMRSPRRSRALFSLPSILRRTSSLGAMVGVCRSVCACTESGRQRGLLLLREPTKSVSAERERESGFFSLSPSLASSPSIPSSGPPTPPPISHSPPPAHPPLPPSPGWGRGSWDLLEFFSFTFLPSFFS